MSGLIRGVARTAAVAGTATAVSNRVSRRQANRWAEQDVAAHPQQAPSPEYVAAPPQQYAERAPEGDMYAQLEKLGALRSAGVLTEEEFAVQKARILATG